MNKGYFCYHRRSSQINCNSSKLRTNLCCCPICRIVKSMPDERMRGRRSCLVNVTHCRGKTAAATMVCTTPIATISVLLLATAAAVVPAAGAGAAVVAAIVTLGKIVNITHTRKHNRTRGNDMALLHTEISTISIEATEQRQLEP